MGERIKSVSTCKNGDWSKPVDIGVNYLKKAKGEAIAINDSAERQFKNLKIYGKSWQDGEPTVEEPKELLHIKNVGVNIFGVNLLKRSEFKKEQNKRFYQFDLPYHTPAGCVITGSVQIEPTTDFVLVLGFATDGTEEYMIIPQKNYNSFELITKKEFFAIRFYAGKNDLDSLDRKAIYQNVKMSAKKTSRFELYKTGGFITLPYTLRGVPVEAGGNYTDKSGQQWIADYVDFDKGVLVRKVSKSGEVLKEETSEKLTNELLNAYKQLTTLYPFTSILNNQGAFMEVEYQTVATQETFANYDSYGNEINSTYATKKELPTKNSLGLSNVDNTHDKDKRVHSAKEAEYAEYAQMARVADVNISEEVLNEYMELGLDF